MLAYPAAEVHPHWAAADVEAVAVPAPEASAVVAAVGMLGRAVAMHMAAPAEVGCIAPAGVAAAAAATLH